MQNFYQYLKETVKPTEEIKDSWLYSFLSEKFDQMISWYLDLSYPIPSSLYKKKFLSSYNILLNKIGHASSNRLKLFNVLANMFTDKLWETKFKAVVIKPINLTKSNEILEPDSVVTVLFRPANYNAGEKPLEMILDYEDRYHKVEINEIFYNLKIAWDSHWDFNKCYPPILKNINGPAGDFIFYKTEYHFSDPFFSYIQALFLPEKIKDFIENKNDFILEVKTFLNENIHSCIMHDNLGDIIYELLQEYKSIKLPEILMLRDI